MNEHKVTHLLDKGNDPSRYTLPYRSSQSSTSTSEDQDDNRMQKKKLWTCLALPKHHATALAYHLVLGPLDALNLITI